MFVDLCRMHGKKLIFKNLNHAFINLPIRDLRMLMVQADKILEDFQPYIRGDKMRLTQVLINLIKNSIKFCNNGGTIVVISAFNPHNNIMTVSVLDTGKGIDETDKTKLFHLFGKLESTADINVEGSGMGLVICKRLVKAN